MNKTQNYQLNQWEASDKVRHQDFNADNAKIDAAVKAVDVRVDGKADQTALTALSQVVAGHAAALDGKGNCRVASGTYTGDGTCGKDHPITLDLDFAPQLVVAQNVGGVQFDAGTAGYAERTLIILARPSPYFYAHHGLQIVRVNWTDQGVSWYCETGATFQMNDTGAEYLYVAIG